MLHLSRLRILRRRTPSCAGRSGISQTRKQRCALAWALACAFSAASFAQTATITTLAIASNGSVVTSVPSGTVVTLTATVPSGGSQVTRGLVKFCDATAAYCEDIHIVGAAQLTGSGTATVKFRPGIGSHSYKAVFVGTTAYAASTSTASPLDVTGTYPTATALTVSGAAGSYSLSATVTGSGGLGTAPAGPVSFLDSSHGNAVLGSGTLSPGATTVTLANPANYATGTNPQSIAEGDFNGDGVADLAIANYQSGTITILLGHGDGTFTPITPDITNAQGPAWLAVADFNGDGIPDLAVANYSSSSLSTSLTILLGNGNGTFRTAPTTPSVSSLGEPIAVGDFNGDGIPDIAAINQSLNAVTILLGNGDGTFTTVPASPATGILPTGIVVGDFNGDGIQDLAITNAASDDVTILLGNGDGTFTQAPSVQDVVNPFGLTVADFNGDGIPDLAVANGLGITVLLGNGNGTFSSTAPIPPPENGSLPYVVAGNFDGSGTPGLAAISYNGPGYGWSVAVYLGDGKGGFSIGTIDNPPGNQNGFIGLAAGDFTGGGVSDLAVTVNALEYSVDILLTEPQISASATASVPLAIGSGTHQLVASYGGDGNYSPSVSNMVPVLTVFPTLLTLSIPPGNYTAGQTVTLTATLSPYTESGYGSTDGETVTFYNTNILGSTTVLGTGTLAGGVATFTTPPLEGDVLYMFTAVYGGNPDFATATSAEEGLGVAPIATSLALTVSPSTPAIGQGVTLTATVSPYEQASLSTDGEPVEFSGSNGNGAQTLLGVGTLSHGVASLATQPLSAGRHVFTAVYGEDSYFGTSTTSVKLTIPQNTTSLSLNASATSITQGQTVTLTSTLSGSYGSSAEGETITFSSNGGTIGSGTVTSGTASISIYTLSPGLNRVTASYAGDTDNVASASNTITVNVTPVGGGTTPTIALTASPNPAFVTYPAIFTAMLSSSTGTPTGSVLFYSGATLLGQGNLRAGTATFTTTSLAAGTYSITAVYSGDTNFVSVTSAALTESIINVAISVPTGASTTATTPPGEQAVYTLTLTPPPGTTFSTAITPSVTGLPAGATATFSPPTIPAGSGTTNVTLTITVPAGTSAQVRPGPNSKDILPAVLCFILLPIFGGLRKRSRRWRNMLCLAVLGMAGLAGSAAVFGCGGGGGGGAASAQNPPPQSYTLTVKASSGAASNTLQLTLIVG